MVKHIARPKAFATRN